MKTLLLSLFALGYMAVDAQSAKDVIKKMDDKMQGSSNRSVMKMSVIRPEWKREVTMKGWSLDRDYSLILITSPARDKGQVFLKRKNEMWNWQPSIDRVIKLPPSMMLQSWMGSDFTNDDLVKQSSVVNDYVHSFRKDTVIGGLPAWQIEMIPKPEAAVVWGQVISCVDKKDFNQLLVLYYDEEGQRVNTLVMSDIREIGGRILPCHLEMIPQDNPRQKTVIEYIELEFDLALKEDFFSMQNLKRMR